jgi:hypothetical protein
MGETTSPLARIPLEHCGLAVLAEGTYLACHEKHKGVVLLSNNPATGKQAHAD